MRFRAVKGMNDILPDEMQRWHRLERAFRRTVELYGYQEVRVPIVESTDLFVRSMGESTDVVSKEMYSFDRHSESLALRPEGTAGVVRAYVEHSTHAHEPVTRWYYLGPMFRAERPQRGRYRQFYQAGCELLGDGGPASDAEMIEMLCEFLRRLGIGELEVRVNCMGGPETRERYRQVLVDYFRPRAAALSGHARERVERNPLRILDSKDPRDIEASREAPRLLDHLAESDREHWLGLRSALDAFGMPYVVDPLLVRGLDYYTRTLFEVCSTSGAIGSQNALIGGGRYDTLVAQLGGPATPAIGFAMGLERLLLVMPDAVEVAPPLCFIAPVGPQAVRFGLLLARELRSLGVRAELDARGRSMKAMLRRADSMRARMCMVLGDAELARSVVAVKDLERHTQQDVAADQAARFVAELLERSEDPPTDAQGGRP
ncbi:MAG: histidine--tRNA ligase [Polyangiaceae bacterium]|nr:histidine--tRNA ligase [Polyangiaceae bacterium]